MKVFYVIGGLATISAAAFTAFMLGDDRPGQTSLPLIKIERVSPDGRVAEHVFATPARFE